MKKDPQASGRILVDFGLLGQKGKNLYTQSRAELSFLVFILELSFLIQSWLKLKITD